MTADSQTATNTEAIDGALVTAFDHLKAGRLQEAEAIYRNVLDARPDHADANHYYGLVALQVGRNDIAADRIGRAIAVDARKAIYHQNLGCALKALGRLDDAVLAFQRALALRPDYASAHYNLGNAFQELARFEEAVTAYRAALEINPDSAETYNNLGSVLKELCRFDESVAAYRRALDGAPDDAETHNNLSHSLLAMGRIEEGWLEYEHRPSRSPPVAVPAWDGGALDGKTILVRAEQGIGDEILFASCLPDLIARAGHCVIECAPRLVCLFARSFPTATVYGSDRDETGSLAVAPPIDIQIRLASLMRHLRPNIDSFPDHRGYLLPDPEARKHFNDRLAALGSGPKIGISWRSMRGSRWRASYAALDDWRKILGMPGVHFVNLQYDDSGSEVADVNQRLGMDVHDFADLDTLNDLDGVAALVAALDLVIAPTNTVANLAGAVGTSLVLLELAANWGSLGCDGYPWFPNATVYRRTPDMADWDIVLARVARDLNAPRCKARRETNRNQRRQDAPSSEAHYRLGNELKSQGRFDDAIAAYRRAVDLEPGLTDVHASLGTVLLATGDPGEAAAAYRRAIAQRPDLVLAWVGLGTALMALERLDEAVDAYSHAVQLNPGHAVAHGGLGRALLRQGKLDDAALSLRRAVALKPDSGDAYSDLGNALRRQGKLDESIAAHRNAVALAPSSADMFNNLGNALKQAGRLDEATAAYRDAIRFNPDLAEVHSNLGNALKEQGRLDGAVAAYGAAIDLEPGFAAAHANLGIALSEMKKYGAAVTAYRTALSFDGSTAGVWNNLGNALREDGRVDEAVAAYRTTVEISPDFAEAHGNLGVALAQQGKFEPAIACFNTAIDLNPGYADAHTNLGNVFCEQGKLDEGIACHDQALTLCPGYADAHCNRAFPLLAQGKIEEGWREYEHRLRKADARTLFVPKPPWNGGPLDGKTIFVHTEQGIGDEILFASCLPDLIAHADHCVIECQPRLGDLFRRSFPTATVGGRPRADLDWLADAPPIDFYVMLASLMRRFRPEYGAFPPHDGYLVADPDARDHFAKRLAALGPGLKVGISWRSLRRSRWHAAYTALEDWRDILALPDAQFVNLQYDDSGAETAEVNNRLGVHVHDFEDLDLLNDLDGVAALISALDLVIAPGNTVTALAGALGAPLWILTPEPNWCMFGTDAYPWFPSATVHLKKIGATDWGAVLDQVARGLRKLTNPSN